MPTRDTMLLRLGLSLGLLLACSREQPKQQAESRESAQATQSAAPTQTPTGLSTLAAGEPRMAAPHPKAQRSRTPKTDRPKRAADGSPLFDHFVGMDCAQARSGETWCPTDSQETTFYRVPFARAIKQVVRTVSPLAYVLSQSGGLFQMGYFDSDVNENWSQHYPSPQRVAGFPELVSIAAARHYFALTKSGQVLTWDLEESRDESHRAMSIKQTKPRVLFPSGVSRIVANWGVCLEHEGKFSCCRELVNARSASRFVPAGLLPRTPVSIGLARSACFGSALGQLDCYAGWTSQGHEPEHLAGHFVLRVQARRVAPVPGLVLDDQGKLFGFKSPNLLANSPRELPSPALTHLVHMGTVVDFTPTPCTITTDGVLGCRNDGEWRTSPTVPVKFTLTPPPHVRGPGG